MNRHMISKQVVELTLDEMEKFHPVADAFTHIINQGVLPKLSVQFDKLSDEHTVITADNIEIDLGVINWKKQQEFVGDQLVEQIVKKISGFIQTRKDQTHYSEHAAIMPATVHQWIIWKQYLKTGILPWFGTTTSQPEWEAQLLHALDSTSSSAIAGIVQDVIMAPEARKRLLLIFSSSFIDAIIRSIGIATEERFSFINFSQWLEAEMKIPGGTFEKLSRSIVINYVYDHNPEIPYFVFLDHLICHYPHQDWIRILRNIGKQSTINGVLSTVGLQKTMQNFIDVLLSPIPENEFKTVVRQVSAITSLEFYFSSRAFQIINDQKIVAGPHSIKKIFTKHEAGIEDKMILPGKESDIILIPEKKELIAEPQYVSYAGLVIAAAFLQMYFEAVGLLSNGSFRNTESRVKGVRLAGFIASGQADVPDWELAVPKILCGLAPSTTISTEGTLDEISLLEADHLLEALIKYWKALGRSSPEGLRQGFLERSGKLTQQDDHWLLQVEAKAIDILLEKISWSIGTIKLPWMPKMLVTEWQATL